MARSPRRGGLQATQAGLLGRGLQCPHVDSLPLIGSDAGKLEVLAPGHAYQPVLLAPSTGDIRIHPGALEKNEQRMVVDLVRTLYPANDPPRAPGAPLLWKGREIHLRRNLDRDAGSFRLRVDDSDWYYPDFILWILDRETRTQTFGFIDPKGLYSQAAGGWGDHKVVSTIFMPHLIERQLGVADAKVEFEGHPWTFRIRGVLLSTSPYGDLEKQAKFKVTDAQLLDVFPPKSSMKSGRILFQEDGQDYIEQMLDMLVEDSSLDMVMKKAARLLSNFDAAPFEPRDHVEAYLAVESLRNTSMSAVIERVIKDLLLCEDVQSLKGAAEARARAMFREAASMVNDPAGGDLPVEELFQKLFRYRAKTAR